MDKLSMLLLEDEKDHYDSFVDVLETICPSIKVTFIQNLEDAMVAFNKSTFDLIIVDLLISGDNTIGRNFVKFVRGKNMTMPIYVITGIEYDGLFDEHDFRSNFKVKYWIKKPISAIDFFDKYIAVDFGISRIS